MKVIEYDNYKFVEDKKTGYYLSNSKINGSRKRLHVYVWEKHNGAIPKGAQVHHKDGNKASTDINNLELLTASEHMRKHWREKTEEQIAGYKERMVENCTKRAVAWHKTEEGKKWHSEHGKRVAENVAERVYKCEYCGKEFKTKPFGKVRYCSNNCRAAARRKSGADQIEHTCVVCGKVFLANKYRKTQTCSRGCANKKWHSEKGHAVK